MMDNNELYSVRGGAVSGFGTASWINAFSRTVELFYKLGKSIGSSISVIIRGRRC